MELVSLCSPSPGEKRFVSPEANPLHSLHMGTCSFTRSRCIYIYGKLTRSPGPAHMHKHKHRIHSWSMVGSAHHAKRDPDSSLITCKASQQLNFSHYQLTIRQSHEHIYADSLICMDIQIFFKKKLEDMTYINNRQRVFDRWINNTHKKCCFGQTTSSRQHGSWC